MLFPQDELFWRLVHYCRELYNHRRRVGFDVDDFEDTVLGLLTGYKHGWIDSDESWREEQGLPSGKTK